MAVKHDTISNGSGARVSLAPPHDAPPFDAYGFGELIKMIGDDGVLEMVEIFSTETRLRLGRLAAGDQNVATLVREMHTLKGAAGTVASPRLTALGLTFEHAARRGVAPTADDLARIGEALEAYLSEVREWSRRKVPAV